jgi:hypothetical protein
MLGTISDSFEENKVSVKSLWAGVVFGQTVNPLVYRGDAVVPVGLLD